MPRSATCGEFAIDAVSAACKLAAVAVAVSPMVNSFAPGVADVVAVSVMVSLVPSGSVKRNWTVSPAFGRPVRSTETAGGDAGRTGDRRVGERRIDAGELEAERRPATSSATCTEVAVGAETTSAAEAVGAEIGLLALRDDLLETGARAVAVHDVIERLDRRLVGGRRKTYSGRRPGC